MPIDDVLEQLDDVPEEVLKEIVEESIIKNSKLTFPENYSYEEIKQLLKTNIIHSICNHSRLSRLMEITSQKYNIKNCPIYITNKIRSIEEHQEFGGHLKIKCPLYNMCSDVYDTMETENANR
jgi:hypothetical protein